MTNHIIRRIASVSSILGMLTLSVLWMTGCPGVYGEDLFGSNAATSGTHSTSDVGTTSDTGVTVSVGSGGGGSGGGGTGGTMNATSTTSTSTGMCSSDLMSDPHNCGTCNHDCLGSTCSVGKCVPTLLASGENYPTAITVDSASVYWISNSTLWQMPKSGGAKTSRITGAASTCNIAKDSSNNVYVSSNGGLYRVPADTTSAPVFMTSVSNNATSDIVADEQFIYWGDSVTLTISRMPLAGGVPSVILSNVHTQCLTVDQNSIYWTTWGTQQVLKAPLNGGSETLLASTSLSSLGIAVGGGMLFWTAQDGYVYSMPTAGGVTTKVFHGGQPEMLSTDSQFVYWAAFQAEVGKATFTGLSHTTLSAEPNAAPWAVAVDDQYVYWTTNGTTGASFMDGSVQRVAK